MVQNKLPLINSKHGSETRNIINELIKLFNGMGYTYNESLQKAQDVLNEAERVNKENVSTQKQIDELILHAGQSDAEVIQARGGLPLLKDRLDKNDAQLAQTGYIAFYKETEDYGTTIQNLYDTIPEGGTLILEHGSFEYSQPLLLNRRVHIDGGQTTLKHTGSSNVAFEVGHSSGLHLNLPFVVQETLDWSLDKIGIRVNNLYSSFVILNGARNFGRGIVIDGTNGVGNSYNKFFITQLWNNKESLVITSSNGGWANENMFFGGRFSWTSDLSSTEGNTHILIDYVDYSNNNNKFYGCSLENAGDRVGHAIREMGGRANSFYDFRYEGATKIFISGSTHYATISNGYGLTSGNVEDNGNSTTIQATNQSIINKGRPTQLKNTSGATNAILELVNVLGSMAMTFYGDGDFSSNGTGYIRKGIELYSEDASQKRSITVYNGDPEGLVTANQGTLLIDRGGNLYIKKSGMETNTGWGKVMTEART